MAPVNTKFRKGNKFTKIALVLVIIALGYLFFESKHPKPETLYVSYNAFINEVDDAKKLIVIPSTGNANTYSVKAKMENGDTLITTIVGDNQLQEVNDIAKYNTIEVENINVSSSGQNNAAFFWCFSVITIVALVLYTISKLLGNIFGGLSHGVGQGGSRADMTKSKARLINSTVKLSDVAGIDNEKYEVEEIIDMIKNPKPYVDAGVKLPKGVLLESEPGMGKSLLAKAIAGEAGIPMYAITGSDFAEMYVGVGAARVRSMFEDARKEASKHGACILFIDEIDAVAKQRSSGSNGNDERESTLNALLTEMDGAGESKHDGVIVLAATNRVELLDSALKRPGRFDRIIKVPSPDTDGREAILKVHSKGKKLCKEVTMSNIAKRTSGFSGAQLEAVMNEAAVMMVRERASVITMAHIDEAIDRVLMGPAQKNRKRSEHERKLVAYHEAGHAVVGLNVDRADVVHKITIVGRGDAAGYVLSMPEEDRIVSTAQDILDRIKGLLGGRIMEELKFGSITTGAHNDLEKATHLARSLVCDYGMSSLGVAQLRTVRGHEYQNTKVSDDTLQRIDTEVNNILNKCYDETRELLKQHMDQVEVIAQYLLEKETITKEQIDELITNMNKEEVQEETAVNVESGFTLAVINDKAE